MDSKSNYDPWFICTTPDGQRYPQYTQRTSNGFKCCQFPDVQDIIYSIDNDKTLISKVLFLTDLNITDTNIYNYLKTYEQVVKTCDYFTKLSSILIFYNVDKKGIANYIETNYSELYEFVVIQMRIFYNFFQQGTIDTLYYVQFDYESLSCGYVTKSSASTYSYTRNNYIPKYVSYEDFHDHKTYKYVPFCASSTTNVGLSNYSIFDEQYSIMSIRNNLSENTPCTTSSCPVISDYYPFAGQNILGDNKTYNQQDNRNYFLYAGVPLLVLLFIICIIVIVRFRKR